MALCIYFWSIGAPILLGDGVLDEGPISENKSFTMLWKKLKGQLHDMYLSLITSSSLANLSPGVSGNDFWTFGNGNGNGSAHSQTLGTGTGMINCIPNFWERERE